MSVSKRFEDKFIPVTESGCWIWIASTRTNGYGQFWYEKKLVTAHRFSYEFYIGPIPEGMCVLHKCDIPLCVNPSHLFLGTHLENMQDMERKGRAKRGGKGKTRVVNNLPDNRGELNHFSKLTEKTVIAIRGDNRKQGIIAKEYSLDRRTVNRIKLKQTWKHI